jgi:hypothetical protein
LAQPGFFHPLWDKGQFEVKAYWTRIETHSPLRMEQVYAAVIQEPALNSHQAYRIGRLLQESGHVEAALHVHARLVDHYRERGDRANTVGALGNPEGLSHSLANQAKLLNSTPGGRREARRLADEALAIATRHGYQQLVPQFRRVCDSIPPGEE